MKSNQTWRHNKNAPVGDAREKLLAERRELLAQHKALKETITPLPDTAGPLITAARFVVDVNGDPPSIDELRVAVEAAERKRDALREMARLQREADDIGGRCQRRRWELFELKNIPGAGPFWERLGAGDTKTAALDHARRKAE